MLELKGVHTHYGLSHVLQGIDLQVGHGEVVGLFGRNGVGKTTVIKTIAGWVSPSSGDVIFNGESINGVGADQICRRGIGLVNRPGCTRHLRASNLRPNRRCNGCLPAYGQIKRSGSTEMNDVVVVGAGLSVRTSGPSHGYGIKVPKRDRPRSSQTPAGVRDES